MNNNDILIYCDAGCKINVEGKDRLFEYVDMLNHNKDNYGILSFQLEFKERMYTKQKILDHFSVDSEYMQNMATVILIKKSFVNLIISSTFLPFICKSIFFKYK